MSTLLRALSAVALCCVAALLSAAPAWATRQVEEELVIDGLVHRMQSTPLEPFLEGLPKRPALGDRLCSALWRGYVGTWSLDGDRLYLLKLRGWADGIADGPVSGEPDPTIPITRVFPDAKGPVAATWFSGQLRIPRGRMLSYVHMGFGTLHEETLYLNLKEGRVVSQHVVDNLREGAVRSRMDMQWLAITQRPLADDGTWRDARTLGTADFRNEVSVGTSFQTRGALIGDGASEPFELWIPATLVTEETRIPLRGAHEAGRSFAHVELDVHWDEGPGGLVLVVEKQRQLEPGESFHHAAYEPPDLEAKLQALRLKANGEPDATLLREDEERGFLHGRIVEVLGRLKPGTVATVNGVEVDGTGGCKGQEVHPVGMLQKWFVTKRMLERGGRVAALFGERGPGVYFRLADPKTGALVGVERDAPGKEVPAPGR